MVTSKQNCIFCEIVKGKSPETILEYEDDTIIIFKDIKPASDHHYLAVPKIHMDNVKSLKKDDRPLIDKLEKDLIQLLETKGLDIKDTVFGFHWPPFISVGHLHMHAIAPASKMSLMSKIIFNYRTSWFCSNEYLKEWIQKQK